MKRSHLQTAALLALGLVGAVTINLWPQSDEGQDAVPAPPSPTTTVSQPAGGNDSGDATKSATETARPSATPAPGPTRGVVIPSRPAASPTPSPSVSASQPTARDVTGLSITQNTSRNLQVSWVPVEGVSRYAVYLNGSRISTVNETSATIIWETPSITVGVAAIGPQGEGNVVTLRAQRPGGADEQPAVRGTEPVRTTRPAARQEPTRAVQQPPVNRAPETRAPAPPPARQPIVRPAPEPILEPEPVPDPVPAPDPEPDPQTDAPVGEVLPVPPNPDPTTEP